MRATVTHIARGDDGHVRVSVHTSAGSATFHSPRYKAAPKVGDVVTLEWTITSAIELGRNAERVSPGSFELTTDDRCVIMRGSIDRCDEDGLVYFRLAPDSLTLIGASPGELRPGEWLRIELDHDSVVAYL